MSIAVHGIEPSAPEGIYFVRNIPGWGSLADFIIETQPDIAEELIDWNESSPVCTIIRGARGWYYNDGDGLNAESSIKLADALDKMLVNGEAAAYIKKWEMRQEQLPDEVCYICKGTGIRNTAWQRGFMGESFDPDDTRCAYCNGSGFLPNFDRLRLEDIREFSRFLRASGGFRIW
jgi:hypothetical protein